MERFKKGIQKLFFLSPLPTVLIAVPSFVFVFIMLVRADHSALSYIAYLLSAYALIITGTGISGMVKAAKNGIHQWPLLGKIQNHPVGRRLVEDAVFRSELTLQGGFLFNLLYAGLNLFYGVRSRSAWFITLAGYYTLLCAMRGLLVHYVHNNFLGENLPAEYRRYRGCGILVLWMNAALAAMVGDMVHQNRGASYPGTLIYGMAAYTFYITIAAIVNVIRFRNHKSPILSAAKGISLTAALVSMLSLENAMITQFGGNQHRFQQIMTSAFGGAICVSVLGMAILMIVRANRKIREFDHSQTNR